jgi:predicted enzyme related to lactoylglutathione lyase
MTAGLHLKYLTFDTPDAMAIAGFWATLIDAAHTPTVLGARGMPDDGAWMRFLPVPEAKFAKNRFHADYDTEDLAQLHNTVLALGGSVWGDYVDDEGFIEFRDPDGNEFCVGEKAGLSPGLTYVGPTFDTSDADAITAWWADVVDGNVVDHPLGKQVIPRFGPRMFFIEVPEPKISKNRCHPDVHATDFEAEVARVIALGAVETARLTETSRFVVFNDPDGNEFCIVEDPHPDPENQPQ